uniref:Uncharacterized protein n=1 Tax=Desertifilum tharense IPPAS B-1220 TaxID=1781255 RepID=A0ACD5GWA3_9CYAN
MQIGNRNFVRPRLDFSGYANRRRERPVSDQRHLQPRGKLPRLRPKDPTICDRPHHYLEYQRSHRLQRVSRLP